MKISFTTLGCPKWDLDTLCNKGREFGYDAVDFRGLGDALDVTTLPAFTTGISETKRRLDEAGLAVSGVSTSIRACDAAKHAANLEEARRTIPVALALGCQNVRIFGGGDVGNVPRSRAAEIGRECIGQILALDGA
ncbi:MAG: TIM barrel protein, partial [Verrucomicrobiota bacterium]